MGHVVVGEPERVSGLRFLLRANKKTVGSRLGLRLPTVLVFDFGRRQLGQSAVLPKGLLSQSLSESASIEPANHHPEPPQPPELLPPLELFWQRLRNT